jgi:hypothetical protein
MMMPYATAATNALTTSVPPMTRRESGAASVVISRSAMRFAPHSGAKLRTAQTTGAKKTAQKTKPMYGFRSRNRPSSGMAKGYARLHVASNRQKEHSSARI